MRLQPPGMGAGGRERRKMASEKARKMVGKKREQRKKEGRKGWGDKE